MFQGRGEVVGMSATGVTINAVDQEELDEQLGEGAKLTVTAQVADPKKMQQFSTGQEVTISMELGATADQRDKDRQTRERRSSASGKTARQGETERSAASTGGGLRRDQEQPTTGRQNEAPGTGAKRE